MRGIHITGASGSGVTTLGRALADQLDATHLDTDDFYWLPSDPPFQDRRAVDVRLRMMREAITASPRDWVLSGSLDGWGDPFIPRFRAVVFVYTPRAARMDRLLARERERYGAAILPGGALYEHHLEFVQWAEGYDAGDRLGRSLPRHQAWLSALPCPVLQLDGLEGVDARADAVIAWVSGLA